MSEGGGNIGNPCFNCLPVEIKYVGGNDGYEQCGGGAREKEGGGIVGVSLVTGVGLEDFRNANRFLLA